MRIGLRAFPAQEFAETADIMDMEAAALDADAPGTAPEAFAAEADPRVGSVLGPYRIQECIGDGGMGRVYRAQHVHLERTVAIKFLLPRFAVDLEAVSRFLEEAKTVNRVRHPNLIDIYDYFVDHDQALVAYVMELLTGRSLRDAMTVDTMGMAHILPITRQITSALQAVHAVGIVHRDLKPENVYLCDGGEAGDIVKVLDFGVAKFTRGQVTHKTQVGMAMGSPWYMAPEQARGAVVDPRADVYSLGVILYELLTGRVPFAGDTYANVLAGHLTKPPPPLRRRDGWVPPDAVSGVVLRCLEKDPQARPADMESAWNELADAAGPQFAAAWTTPAGMRVGRTPKSSRMTLPLVGSDPPLRLTPIEGEPVLHAESPSESCLPMVVPPPTELVIALEPSVEGAPTPIPAVVLRPLPLRSRGMPVWGWAMMGAVVGFALLALFAVRRPPATPALVVEPPAPVQMHAAAAPLPPPAPRPEPDPPVVPIAEAPTPDLAGAPVAPPVPKAAPAVHPATRSASRSRASRASSPRSAAPRPGTRPVNSRDAIIDPFR